MHRIVFCFVILSFAGSAHAGGLGYITNPGKLVKDTKNRIGDGRKGPILFHRPEESGSYLAVTSRPFIDKNGWVYSGTGNSGQTPRRVRKAGERRLNGRWMWVSSYSDIIGKPSPRPIGGARLAQLQQNDRQRQQQQQWAALQRQRQQQQQWAEQQRQRQQRAAQQQQQAQQQQFQQNWNQLNDRQKVAVGVMAIIGAALSN